LRRAAFPAAEKRMRNGIRLTSSMVAVS
jgi:hypothetical protein